MKGLHIGLKALLPGLKGLHIGLKALLPELKGLHIGLKALLPGLKGLQTGFKALQRREDWFVAHGPIKPHPPAPIARACLAGTNRGAGRGCCKYPAEPDQGAS